MGSVSREDHEAIVVELQSRIEALERARMLAISEWSTWKDVLLCSNMTEADWQETMDGLRAPSALDAEDD